MITVLEVVARSGPGGRTVLPVVRASGQLAVRLPLPGGWVATAWGTELHRVVATAEALTVPGGRATA